MKTSLHTPTKHVMRWSSFDLAVIDFGVLHQISHKVIAQKLKRSPASVAKKINRMGLMAPLFLGSKKRGLFSAAAVKEHQTILERLEHNDDFKMLIKRYQDNLPRPKGVCSKSVTPKEPEELQIIAPQALLSYAKAYELIVNPMPQEHPLSKHKPYLVNGEPQSTAYVLSLINLKRYQQGRQPLLLDGIRLCAPNYLSHIMREAKAKNPI